MKPNLGRSVVAVAFILLADQTLSTPVQSRSVPVYQPPAGIIGSSHIAKQSVEAQSIMAPAVHAPDTTAVAPAYVQVAPVLTSDVAPCMNHFLYLPIAKGNSSGYVVASKANAAPAAADMPATLPVDPCLIAPPVAAGVPTNFADSTSFIYSGTNPIQTGVVSGTIETYRVAVLNGRVLMNSGGPLPGVTITVLGHPEYGQTLSRVDGRFDLAVNGGGSITLNYTRTGFLTTQRQADAAWNDFGSVPDVVMLNVDPNVTLIDLSAIIPMQVAQGSVVSDADGMRQASLFFPQGTSATMSFTNGTTQTITTMHVRITEFTVGPNGMKAMPGDLPPASGYTYAAEYTIDEAVAAGAQSVNFSQPVIHYSQNFLNFAVGMGVPSGFYDRSQGQWIAEPNGRVVKVVSITGGMADLDTDGDGIADNGAVITPSLVLTITNAERQRLAEVAQPGETLWRVPLNHFSPGDLNWAYGLPPDAISPNGSDPQDDDPDNPDNQCGSIIGCQGQKLGESVAVVGTPYRLYYSSARVPGRKAAYSLDIPLSGSVLPASLRGIVLEVEVAGRYSAKTFAPAANLHTTFTWDGKDSYGRILSGKQAIKVRIGFSYQAVYYASSIALGRIFNTYGNMLTRNIARQDATLSRVWIGSIGALDSQLYGLGGLLLDVQHTYDSRNKTLYLGNGEQYSASTLNYDIITTIAGNGHAGYHGDNITATQTTLFYPEAVAAGSDGSVYIADNANYRVRRVLPNGIITTTAGDGQSCYPGTAPCGDGGPATQAQIGPPNRISVGPDGSLYIVAGGVERVRRVGPDGIITTVAGNGTVGFGGDGGPATQTQFSSLKAAAAGKDGSLFIVDNMFLRRVGPDGIITTVAGLLPQPGPECCYNGDGIPASQAKLQNPNAVVVGPDGSVYIADEGNLRIRRISPDGIIHTVAGNGDHCSVPTDACGDGGLATDARLRGDTDVAVGPDGSLYIAEGVMGERIRRVGPDGIITTIAGTGNSAWNINGVSVDGGVAQRFDLWTPDGVAVSPDGSVYIADNGSFRIRRVASALPGVTPGDMTIPSPDGSQVYIFNSRGQHLRTLQALTGAVMYQFGYDGQGQLINITDGDGNITTITRDANGNPTGIVAPFGQVTSFTRNANNYIASITNPANDTVQLSYTADGLLTSYRDPRNNLHTFEYDALGRLVKDTDPASGFKQLSRQESPGAYTITLTTALGRTDQYRMEIASGTGNEHRINTNSAGLQSELLRRSNATEFSRAPDGSTSAVILAPDPRWGMLAPVQGGMTDTLPSGLSYSEQVTRTASLTNPVNPFSLDVFTDTTTLNDRVYQTVYQGATRTITQTSPAGRQTFTTLDQLERPLQSQVAGLQPTRFGYDNHGRMITATAGTGSDARTVSFSYNASGYLQSITDALSHTTAFDYDAAGRVIRQTEPDGREIDLAYDASGNMTSITPPGRPAHTFTYTPVDLVATYTPPNVGSGNTSTSYTYNADRQLTRLTRPDGRTVDMGYDMAGRTSAITITRGTIGFTYNAATGNVATVTAPGGLTEAFTYDGSLLTGESLRGPVAATITATYDNNLRVASLAVNGDAIGFSYDSDGLPVQAGALALTRSAQNSLLTGSTMGAVTDTIGYNGFGEPVSYSAAYSATSLLDVQYARDKLGRIAAKTETIGGATTVYTYTYDLADRLTGVMSNGVPIEAYSYDSNGNRLSFTGPGGVITGTYDAQDRLLRYGAASYGYTSNGELLTKTLSAQTTAYQYDELGNLMAVSLPNGTQISYVIDGQNRRIGKRINGTLVRGWLYEDQLRPVAELDGNGNIVSRFIYATRVNVPDYMIKNGVTYRLILDHLGSVRLVVNAVDGTVVQRMVYDTFGQVMIDINPGFQPFGYAGGLYDSDTTLSRFGARDYDAYIGRWLTKDPAGFASGDTNPYTYVSNAPNDSLDPIGFDGMSPAELDQLLKKRNETILKLNRKVNQCTPPGPLVPISPWGMPLYVYKTLKFLQPFLEAANEGVNREKQVLEDAQKAQESNEQLRKAQEAQQMFNRLGLYFPWQTPPTPDGGT